MASVLVADSSPVTRRGFRLALEAHGFEMCSEVGTAVDALAAARRNKPDVALVDAALPGGGIVTVRRIAQCVPGTSIVVLTERRDERELSDAMAAGARGYLGKDIDLSRLGPALDGVMRGEAALPRDLLGRLIDELSGRGRRTVNVDGRVVHLTMRQWDVLMLLRGGASTEEIATRLFVSPATVRAHISAIVRKLNVPDRASAAQLAWPSPEVGV